MGLTINEIKALLDDKVLPSGNRQVAMIPNAEEPVSDQDSEEEEDTEGVGMDIDHLGQGMLSQAGEIIFNDTEDNEPDLQVLNDFGEVVMPVMDETRRQDEQEDEAEDEEPEDEPVAGPSKRQRTVGQPAAAVATAPDPVCPAPQLGRKKNKERLWRRSPEAHFGDDVPPFQPVLPSSPVNDNLYLPYDFLHLFITDEFLDTVSHKSKLYCIRKGAMDKAALLTKDNLLTSMGIMYLSGYMTPAQKELWWENRQDTQNMYVKKAMSRDVFRKVTSHTYFVEPENQDLSDPFWKVRPLFNEINNTAKQQSEFVSVDESMIRYFGPHPLKQAIR